ncbi:MAG: BMC domain-containing protein [Firmicutes bacterium]|nr:BMC domain-containing protein [Bacillota bacterium]
MSDALGLIEAIGYAPSMAAVDAACKCAEVEFLGLETVIGAGGKASVVVKFRGEVATVTTAVEAGLAAARSVGEVLAWRVMPRPHESLSRLIWSEETQASIICR